MDINYFLLMASGFLAVLAAGQLFVPHKTAVNILLCLLKIVCFIWIAHGIGFRLGMLDAYPHLNKLYLPFLAATGPLWYLYLRISVSGKCWTKEDRKHFVPTILSVILMTPFVLQSELFKREYVDTNVSDFVTLTIYLATRVAEITTIFYLVIAVLQIRRSQGQGLYLILISLSVVAIIAAVSRLIGAVFGNYLVSVLIPISIMLPAFMAFYFLGHRHPHLMGFGILISQPEPEPEIVTITREGTELLESYRIRLKENLWHLNPNLKIQELARRLGTPVHDLSGLINRESGGNFKSFVNALRIEYSKELLLNDSNQTIKDIAHASGFNSASVYNEQFKRLESMPPAAFRTRYEKSCISTSSQQENPDNCT